MNSKLASYLFRDRLEYALRFFNEAMDIAKREGISQRELENYMISITPENGLKLASKMFWPESPAFRPGDGVT